MATPLDLLPPDVRRDLTMVDALARRAVGHPHPLVAAVARQSWDAGGKRLRAALCLLCGRFGRPGRRLAVVRAAAGLELVHLASLIHDDVIDGSPTRRGQPSAWALWGARAAVLGGDFLFSASLDLLLPGLRDGAPSRRGRRSDLRLVQVAARAVRELVAGAIAEQAEVLAGTPSRLAYFRRIRRKTASLVAAACCMGAIAGGAPPAVERRLALYGLRLGLAFQVTDDILNLVGDPARTGKPTGGDLLAGIPTLPLCYGLQDPAARPTLAACWGNPAASPGDVAAAVAALAACGALDRARRVARALARRAAAAVAPLTGQGPSGPLADLAAWVASREA